MQTIIEKIFQKIPIARTIYKSILQRIFKYLHNHKGDNILKEDYDFLIILDACRYDTFKELNFIKGKLSKKIALETQTGEWAKKIFSKKYDDIVYVAGGPIRYRNKEGGLTYFDNCVHHMENVWKNNWNDTYKTTLPESMTKSTLKLIEKYPNKKLVLHFLQPHYPFITPKSLVILKENNNQNLFELAKLGKISKETIIQLYKENLIIVLKEVEKLIENLGGRIIITADHGEAFGEKFIWEHVSEIHIKELLEVPWLVIDKPKINQEKKIVSQSLEGINF
jgi:hypothetical protein